jgi:hypothetical protein
MNTNQKIEENLLKIEAYLASASQDVFGSKYVDVFLKRLKEAERKTSEEEEKTIFISGIPRNYKWIRIKPSDELTPVKIKQLAENSNLTCQIQEDGFFLVYGEDKKIKEFVKEIAIKLDVKTERK